MTKEEMEKAYADSLGMTPETQPEFFSYVLDIYETPSWRSMEKYIQHADITRCQHILSVAYLSFLTAKEEGLNVSDAARGAMLHDLFYYDWHVRGDGSHRLHGYRHPGFALKNAEKLFRLNDTQRDIIIHHMWPLTPAMPKTKEGLADSKCDKFCAWQEIIREKKAKKE